MKLRDEIRSLVMECKKEYEEKVRRHKAVYYDNSGNNLLERNIFAACLNDLCPDFSEKDFFISISRATGASIEEYYYKLWYKIEDTLIIFSSLCGNVSVEEIKNELITDSRYCYLMDKNVYFETMISHMKSNVYVNNLEIYITRKYGNISLADELQIYHDKMLAEIEKKSLEKAEEERKRREEREQREKDELEQLVKETACKIRERITVDNKVTSSGDTLFVELFKRYRLYLPARLHGWVNKAMTQLIFPTHDNDKVLYSYRNGFTASKSIWTYIQDLLTKIDNDVELNERKEGGYDNEVS